MSKQKFFPNPTDVIGTQATPATLTATYTDNDSELKAELIDTLSLTVDYVSNAAGNANSYVEIKIDVSHVNAPTIGTEDDWAPYGGVVYGTSENDVHDAPFVVPGDKVSVAGTAERRSFFVEIPPARWVRISVREVGNGANFGTVWISEARIESL